MSFKGLDIDDVFDKVAEQSDDAIEEREALKKKSKNSGQLESEPILKTKQEKEPVVKEKEPVVKETKTVEKRRFNVNEEGLTRRAVEKILVMNNKLNSYTKEEKDFVVAYFGKENKEGNAEAIYSALTADPRELKALNIIVLAKKKDSAERAFYLMELDNFVISDVFKQVSMLPGKLEDFGEITNQNKLKVCREIEKAIANMPPKAVASLSKLQEFTKEAL